MLKLQVRVYVISVCIFSEYFFIIHYLFIHFLLAIHYHLCCVFHYNNFFVCSCSLPGKEFFYKTIVYYYSHVTCAQLSNHILCGDSKHNSKRNLFINTVAQLGNTLPTHLLTFCS